MKQYYICVLELRNILCLVIGSSLRNKLVTKAQEMQTSLLSVSVFGINLYMYNTTLFTLTANTHLWGKTYFTILMALPLTSTCLLADCNYYKQHNTCQFITNLYFWLSSVVPDTTVRHSNIPDSPNWFEQTLKEYIFD